MTVYHSAQRIFGGSGRKMLNRVLRDLQEPDPVQGREGGLRLAAIGCVYWWPAPIGATG